MSKQTPLTSRRGLSPHNFIQKMADWECAVFDDAEYFTAMTYGDNGERLVHRFDKFKEAMQFVGDKKQYCIYAISRTGRSIICDRVKWAEWAEREDGSQQ
jgi:hypothetical protein